MNVSIKVFPAKNGDCILVSYGNGTNKNILIDGGYVDTFKSYLTKTLTEIKGKGECINNFIVTHIDSDHILGAIALIKANNDNNIISIGSIWHNTFRHLFDLDELSVSTDDISSKLLKQIVARGYKKNETQSPTGEVSAKQGSTLGAHLLDGKYQWNAEYNYKAVCIENGQYIKLDQGSSIFLLSPNSSKLSALKTYWSEKLVEYGINYTKGSAQIYDDAFEMLMSWDKRNIVAKEKPKSAGTVTIDALLQESEHLDRTPTNGSSIAFILNIEKKKMLFLADAHPDLVLESLNGYQPEGVVFFDVIKVAHHGSSANTSKALLEKIDAKKFIISTNGDKDGHPDKTTIARIVGRKSNFHRQLIFNYKTLTSQFFDKKEWKEKYDYSINYLDLEPYTLTIHE